MGWAKDMLFLGGYLSPAVLAQEIELEQAREAAKALARTVAAPAGTSAATAGGAGSVGAVHAPARHCA